MMKLLKIAMLLASIPLLAIGGEGIYHAARSRQQIAVTCDQFSGQPPRALWLRVSGCDVDYMGAGYRESGGRISELFFPVRPVAHARTAPASLVVATRDSEVLEIAQNTIGSGRQPDQEAFLVMMLRIVTMLRVSKEIEGYARSGVVELLKTRRALTGLSAPLAQEVLVLDLHARPDFLVPGIEAGAGLCLLVLGLVLPARRSPSGIESRAMPPASDVKPLSGPPRRRLPDLMLLNLDAAADASAIEHAAPLGNRSEVARQIAGVLEGFRVDGDGHGTFHGEDWSLTLDFAGDEKVWTITVVACGDGSVRALESLAVATGWRIFVPKRGTFAKPAQLAEMDPP
jgi:hypothetical protein